MNGKAAACRQTAYAGLTFTCLLTSAIAALAQSQIVPASEQWLPKDGLYARPGKNFDAYCGEEAHYILIELADKSVSGNEWSCKITRRANTAAGAIRLDMTCYDYNLTQALYPKDPNAGDRKVREVMLIKRLDNGAISIRKTVNNKFTDSFWRADYCPDQVQRIRLERDAEARLKTVQEKSMNNPWHPKVEVYSAPGANFAERCLTGARRLSTSAKDRSPAGPRNAA